MMVIRMRGNDEDDETKIGKESLMKEMRDY